MKPYLRPGFARKLVGGAVVATLGLMLSACLLAPGKFTSNLDIRKDGRFSFAYSGEMYVLPLSEFAKNGGKSGDDGVFKPEPCKTSSGAERECSSAELDRQMRKWEEEQKSAAERKAQEAKQMTAMMGGVDMSDPKSAEEFAASLRRQAGWKKVTYLGKGLFEVEYAISGTLSHDFLFPTMEGFPMANPFVQLSLRNDGSVRVDAPGYSSGAAGGPLKGLASMAAMDQSKGKKDEVPQLPQIDGRFTITTDGEILANNTEEGPQADPRGRKLSWTVNARTETEPTALVRLMR